MIEGIVLEGTKVRIAPEHSSICYHELTGKLKSDIEPNTILVVDRCWKYENTKLPTYAFKGTNWCLNGFFLEVVDDD